MYLQSGLFILSIFLRNFKNIYTGLHVHELTIDFSNQQNHICIICGETGKGKTSLLSYLTPFATLGTFDIRNTNKLILEGEEGYKEIVFVDETSTYTISHYYIPSSNGSISIKSYFKKDGVELNESGNVRSFEKLVSLYMDIEIDYLKLVRVGDNVQNLIKSRASERKVFMGKILDEIDFYLKRYKQMSERERELKIVISHMLDSLKKLGIDDVDIAERNLSQHTNEISQIERTILGEEKRKEIKLREISQIAYPEDGDKKIKEIYQRIKKYEKVLDRTLDPGALQITFDKMKEEKSNLEGDLKAEIKGKEILLESLDRALTQLEKLELELEKEKDGLNLESLEQHLIMVRGKVASIYTTKFDEIETKCTKEEFDDFVVFIKNTQKILDATYEVGKKPIQEVLKAMKKNKDIPKLITSKLIYIEATERAQRMSLIDRLIARYESEQIDCMRDCPYKKLHEELMEIKNSYATTSAKYDVEFYQLMKIAYENIKRVFDELKKYRELINRLPVQIQALFAIESLTERIGNTDIIYDETIINNYLSYLADLTLYQEYQKELLEVESEIEKMKNISKVDFFQSQIEDTKEMISSTKERLDELTDSIDIKENKINKLTESLETLETQIAAIKEYDQTVEDYNDLIEKQKQTNVINNEMIDISSNIYQLKASLQKKIQDKCKLEGSIEQYKQLFHEITIKSEERQDYEYLKYAYSSKNGIPLFYIKSFLTDIKDMANDILDIIFDGSLRLKKFRIDADTFDIPYEKNGVVIEDVSQSSQGEQSYINMALSTAIHAKRLTKYNIASYDEVDSTFDDDKRQKFIPVMERIIKLNHISQAFLITHNLMYTQYPVDRIDLDDLSRSTVKVSTRP